MYVTEVAVSPDRRRLGAGAALMKGVDEVAALRNVETIYLHVDVANKAACAMYERMGYRYLGKDTSLQSFSSRSSHPPHTLNYIVSSHNML